MACHVMSFMGRDKMMGRTMAVTPELSMFNRKMMDMLEDMAACFPEVTEFALAISPAGRMLISLDPCHGQKLFNTFVALPYESRILARDEAFLMNQTEFGPTDVNVVTLIKRVWKEASSEDRDAIWKHLHVLIILNKRCVALVTSVKSCSHEST